MVYKIDLQQMNEFKYVLRNLLKNCKHIFLLFLRKQARKQVIVVITE